MKTKLINLLETMQYLLKYVKFASLDSKTTFNYLAGINRSITPAQVTKLVKSLTKIGSIRPITCCYLDFITGKRELYVLDGQHLLNALLRLGWPIPYIIIDVKDKQDLVEKIALLNSSSKSWALADYVTAWSSLVPDYVKLNKYFNIYDMEHSILAAILCNTTLGSGANITRKIKNGEFRVHDEETNVKIIDDLTDILNIIPRMSRYENRYVCSEYVNFRRTIGCSYDHKKFMHKLSNDRDKFILATQEQEKLADMFRNLTK